MAGEGNWTCVKGVLGWILDTEAGKVNLPERKLEELLTLVYIPATQRRVGRKDLEHLVGKLRFMHLTVPGAVEHPFHIQRALNLGGVDRAWIYLAFHSKFADWKELALQTESQLAHLAEIVRQEPTHLGFCDASGLGARGVWINLTGTGQNLVWQITWPPDIVTSLVSSTNPYGTISNSDLELAALVLQEATLLKAVPKARMAAPRSGSDNTPTFSWSMHEAFMINPVVADLLLIRALHSGNFFLNTSISTTQAKETVWPAMLHAYFIHLTPTLSPTCLSSTSSRTVCSRSSFRCRN